MAVCLGRLANGMLAAQVGNRHATFLFPEYPNNLFFVKSALLHRLLLKNGIRLYSFLDQFTGLRSSGVIVMNSSNASVAAFERLTPYCAAKARVDMLVRFLATEWGPQGIRVNAFNPGYTDHSMTSEGQVFLKDADSDIIARTPLRRKAQLKEMVGPAIFLASDAASFITGTILLVDGGWCDC